MDIHRSLDPSQSSPCIYYVLLQVGERRYEKMHNPVIQSGMYFVGIRYDWVNFVWWNGEACDRTRSGFTDYTLVLQVSNYFSY